MLGFSDWLVVYPGIFRGSSLCVLWFSNQTLINKDQTNRKRIRLANQAIFKEKITKHFFPIDLKLRSHWVTFFRPLLWLWQASSFTAVYSTHFRFGLCWAHGTPSSSQEKKKKRLIFKLTSRLPLLLVISLLLCAIYCALATEKNRRGVSERVFV